MTTVQGLYMLLVISCCDGTNRVGRMYHYAAVEMLHKINPGFAKLNLAIPEQAEQRRALAKLYWGTFIYEW